MEQPSPCRIPKDSALPYSEAILCHSSTSSPDFGLFDRSPSPYPVNGNAMPLMVLGLLIALWWPQTSPK